MSPEAVDALSSLANAGTPVLLLAAIGVLWRKLEATQKAMFEQQKTDADRLLDERTVVIPLVRDSTEALRRTTDQLAVTTALNVDLRDQLARHNPNGNR